MRTTLCMVLFVVAVASAAEPLANLNNGSCSKPDVIAVGPQAQGFDSGRPSAALLSSQERSRRESEFLDIGRASLAPVLTSESTEDQCSWYKKIIYYPDNTYTFGTSCGSQVFFCNGLVGSGGPCRTPFFIVYYCDCIEEGEF